MYNISLRDGVAYFALYLVTYNAKLDDNVTKVMTKYIYTEDEKNEILKEDANADFTIIDPPPAEILSRAEQIKGKTFSIDEFNYLLYNKTQEEQMQEILDKLVIQLLS